MITLRDYQIEASTKANQSLRDYKIAYFCFETRTGKTITAFETIRKYGSKNVLFVTKLKAIKSVESDYENYKTWFECKVINYDSLHKVQGCFDLVVCDEAHGLGAFPKANKRVKEVMRLTLGLPIIYLSATPTPESYSQLYFQFYISSNSPFMGDKNFYKWAHKFVDIKKKYLYNRELNDYSHARIADIEPLVKHLFFTQTQVDSGFEQTITEQIITVPMSELQKTMIEKLLKDRIVTGKSGAVILGDTAVKLMSKIHQLCSGTVKDEEGNGHILSYNKANLIKERFAGQRIAIYYKFKAEFEMLKTTFPDYTESPEEFQAGIKQPFLGQFLSAREGIRLDKADSIIFVNLDYAYLSFEQARNRIVSNERTKKAVLYWIFSEGGIETKIHAMVCKKKDYTLYYFKKQFDVGKFISGQDNQAENQGRLVLYPVAADE